MHGWAVVPFVKWSIHVKSCQVDRSDVVFFDFHQDTNTSADFEIQRGIGPLFKMAQYLF
jgi:hypothetical protein